MNIVITNKTRSKEFKPYYYLFDQVAKVAEKELELTLANLELVKGNDSGSAIDSPVNNSNDKSDINGKNNNSNELPNTGEVSAALIGVYGTIILLVGVYIFKKK